MVGDQFFKTLMEAQKHDLKSIVVSGFPPPNEGAEEEHNRLIEDIVDLMINYATPIVDILTTSPTSRAKARKNNGAVKPKSKKQKITAATVPEP